MTGRGLWEYDPHMGGDGRQYVVIASGALSAGLLRTLHNDASNSPGKIFVFTLEHWPNYE